MAATYRTSAAGGGTSGTTDRTAVITPAVGDFWLVFCNASGNTNTTPTCSDNNGGTYTRVGAVLKNGSADCLSVFARNQTLTNTTSTTVTVATGANTAAEVVVVALAGMLRTGSSAVRGSGFQANQAASTTPAPALPAAALTTNPTVIAVANGTAGGSVWVPPTGWTERQDVSQSTPTTGLEVATRDSGFTGTSSTAGAGTSASAFASVIVEVDGSPPVYTGSAAVTHGPRTASGSATFTKPVYTGSTAVTHGRLTAAASGTVTGVYTGSAAVTRGAVTAAGSGGTSAPHPVGVLTTFRGGIYGRRYGDFSGKPNTPPYSEGVAAVSVGGLTAAGSGSFSYPHPVGVLTQQRAGIYGKRYGSFSGKGGSDSTGAVTLGAKAAAGSATFTPPVYTGSAAVSRGAVTAAGSSLFVTPVYDGTGAAALAGHTAAAAATFTRPVYTGSGAVSRAAVTATGVAAFAAQVYLGGAAVSVAPKAAAGSGSVAVPAYTGSGTITRGPVAAAGSAQFAAPVYDSFAEVVVGAKTAHGSGHATDGSPPDAAPGGTFRRPLWSWPRTFPRPLWSWARTWRYSPVNALPPLTLAKPASEDRDYAVDFSPAPELKAGSGVTLVSGQVLGGDGLTIADPVLLAADFDAVPAGKGFSVRVSGGEDDRTYAFAVLATLSNGRKLVVPCRVAVTADYE